MEDFEQHLVALRPKLHRYCARMTGSVVDGEDVVQDAVAKALAAFPQASPIANFDRWLFRIAHNAALDFLRRRERQEAMRSDEDPDMIIDSATDSEKSATTAVSFRTFMRLPAIQRSSVILMDVLGYTMPEIGNVMDVSVPAVKSALHRGRMRLRELSREPEDVPLPSLTEAEHSLLTTYVDRFNAHDFDAVRDLLAAEVRCEVVNKLWLNGRKEVASYFHNYAALGDWYFKPGLVDRRAAILVFNPEDLVAPPIYFVLLEWLGGTVLNIRDFRFARYATEGAEIVISC